MTNTQPNGPGDSVASAPPCPICKASARLFCDKTRFDRVWNIHKCDRCGHGFVANRPSLEYLEQVYSQEQASDLTSMWDRAQATYERRRDCQGLVSKLCRVTSMRSGALDVGSGDGGFSYYLAKSGFQPFMIDLDPRAERAAERVPGATFSLSTFEDFADRFRAGADFKPLAAIVMSQVLEHALHPIDWMRRAAGLLAPEGVLAIAVPNFNGVYRLLGTRDPFLIPPYHLNFFSPRSLSLALESAGLQVAAMDSRSEVQNGAGLSLKRRAAGRIWNLLSCPLDMTHRGIIMRCFARHA